MESQADNNLLRKEKRNEYQNTLLCVFLASWVCDESLSYIYNNAFLGNSISQLNKNDFLPQILRHMPLYKAMTLHLFIGE